MMRPLFTLLTAEPGPDCRADPRPVDGDPRPRRLVGVARYKRSEAELLQPLLAGNRRARHERRIIGGKEDDAVGALIGRADVADLSGACRGDSFSRSPRFVSLQM
jgi:hypothetical protein